MNINLRHLRALHAIWAQGSFVRAAAELGVVPSALTETIRQFEEAVGAPLFDRSQRPPVPTQLALTFLHETQPLLDGLNRAFLRLRSGRPASGQVSIGCTPSAIHDLVAPALARFRQTHPLVRLLVHDNIAEHLARQVVDGDLDLAVAGRALHSADLRQVEISRDPFGLACAASHKLAQQQMVSLSEIDQSEVIALDPGTGTQQLLANCPFVPPALRLGAMEAHSTIAQISLIRAGLGVGLLPRNALLLFGDPSLRFVPIRDLDLWRRLYLLLPVRRPLSAPARALADLLSQIADKVGSGIMISN